MDMQVHRLVEDRSDFSSDMNLPLFKPARPPVPVIDQQRDSLLTPFGLSTLRDSYLLQGEGPQNLFSRVCSAFADDQEHCQRLYDYMSNLWFMGATPVLSNGGTTRGLPISCYLNSVGDSLRSIMDVWQECGELASRGGGIGTYWGHVREVGAIVGKGRQAVGQTSGIIPFIKVQESVLNAITQGSLRRGNAAVYLPVWHPEIEEFIEIRKVTSGDTSRKAIHINNAVVIDDAFMHAVREGKEYSLRSPKTGKVIRQLDARSLWSRILTLRVETGEPYLLFIDTVNRMAPEQNKKLGLKVTMSNLCSEIALPTGKDHRGQERTAVCCLSSLNLEKWDEWHDHPTFIEDVMRFLDNVLQNFIDTAPEALGKARYAAIRERSVGLGVMGLHSLFQKKNLPLESPMAKGLNLKIFKHIKEQTNRASIKLAMERGPCPDAAEAGIMVRFSHCTALAPTATISTICGGSSPGIEPRVANAYAHKTKTGNFEVRNQYLKVVLAKHKRDDEETWSSIVTNNGSVQHLDFLSELEKRVYLTAYEIDQRWLVELAKDRAPFIDQSQSLNLFITPHTDRATLHYLHYMAWKGGVKTLYYVRSMSAQRAETASHRPTEHPELDLNSECIACQ